ncbi:MAG TPA: dimethylsulfonioproprionate lyase family protein [Steroidobacteraceae bacterium]
MTTAVDIAVRIKRLLESLHESALAPFLAEWPESRAIRMQAAADLPVLRWLDAVCRDAAAFGIELLSALCRAAPQLAWRQTYAEKDIGRAFLDNYGWCAIISGDGPLASERIACGFLLLGPQVHYPSHRHPAEEMYLILSGTAAWQRGAGAWTDRAPGALIHHAGDEPHAMRTSASPLLALYLWRGAHIARAAALDPGPGVRPR